MRNDIAVVIPYYHTHLTELEKISYENCLNVLKNHPIILVVPDHIPREDYLLKDRVTYETVPSYWMESVESYNQMMISKDFYNRFIKYEYILIFQLDAFVFSDSLEQFYKYGYDYIGAPWLNGVKYLRTLKRGVWYVGNGGLSLRRISAFLNILNRESINYIDTHEDAFWASYDSEDFRVAPIEIALKFAFEKDVRRCFLLNHNEIPFGCHAWEKYDFEFWRPIFEEKGYYLHSQIEKGIDNNNNASITDISYLEAKEEIVQLCLTKLTSVKEPIICVFGAGRKGNECCWLLQHSKVKNIRCVDNDKRLWGTFLWEIPIEAPEILKTEESNIIVVIAVVKMKNEVLSQLEKWGYIYKKNVILYDDVLDCIKLELSNQIV